MRTKTSIFMVIVFIIKHSFSAIFSYIPSKLYIDDYTNSREASSHRGLLLSYSTVQKKLLCEDHFSAQLYFVHETINVEDIVNILITDGQETEDEHEYNPIVSQIFLTGGENDDVVQKNEIFIECFGTKFERREPYAFGQYFISYGFQYGRWLASTRLEAHDQEYIVLGHNIGTSPQHVPMERIKLEEQYVTTREIIEELRYESPEYIRLIEDKDDLSSMTKWQRAALWASLLSSPIYRKERVEYSTKWILDHADDLIYAKMPLPFAYNNWQGKKNTFDCDCIIFKGFANGDDEKSESINLCMTRSYDNLSSVYIIKLHSTFNYLDKYFKGMSILANSRELFKNYSERMSLELSIKLLLNNPDV